MVNMNITMPEYEPIERDNGPGYMSFSKPYDRETAVMQFEERYGFSPVEINEYKNLLMLGPVPEEADYIINGGLSQ